MPDGQVVSGTIKNSGQMMLMGHTGCSIQRYLYCLTEQLFGVHLCLTDQLFDVHLCLTEQLFGVHLCLTGIFNDNLFDIYVPGLRVSQSPYCN